MAEEFDADNIGRYQAFTHIVHAEEDAEYIYRICTATGQLWIWDWDTKAKQRKWVVLCQSKKKTSTIRPRSISRISHLLTVYHYGKQVKMTKFGILTNISR